MWYRSPREVIPIQLTVLPDEFVILVDDEGVVLSHRATGPEGDRISWGLLSQRGTFWLCRGVPGRSLHIVEVEPRGDGEGFTVADNLADAATRLPLNPGPYSISAPEQLLTVAHLPVPAREIYWEFWSAA